MAASNKINKVKVKSPEGEVKLVFPVDARELVAQGWTANVKAADWMDVENQEKPAVVETSVEEQLEDIKDSVSTMNSKEVDAYVKAHDILIDGYGEMNLNKKRKALIAVLETVEEVDEDEDEDL